jgi:hypothetical protein
MLARIQHLLHPLIYTEVPEKAKNRTITWSGDTGHGHVFFYSFIHMCIHCLGHYIWRNISKHNRKSCTAMFKAPLLPTAKLWNQHRCPSMDEWVKKSEIMSFAGRWVKAKVTMLNEISRTETNITCFFSNAQYRA